ncbi:MAG TPA: alanine racemase, partial [Sphingobacterium sp.]|nr:alanine racemase [Sphingobacterium sp.]
KSNCSIIDDSYSNDLASLRIALNFLRQQNQHTKKSLVITDFVGAVWDDKLQEKLVKLLQEISFHKVVLVGTHIKALAPRLSADVLVFDDTAGLIEALPGINFSEETVLIKGARKFELENIINLLVQKSHDTVLEINLKSIEHNLSQYRSKLQPDVKLMAMVKAFSYGSGSFEVANVLQFNNVDYLTVAFADEGVELRQGGIQLPIMVLSPHEGTFEDLLRYNLEPEIYSFRILKSFLYFLENKNIKGYPIHIKLDTGMHRLGFMPEDMVGLQEVLIRTDLVQVKSIFSHLVGAGNPKFDTFTDEQVNLFRELALVLEQKLDYPVIKHICNSNAIVHRADDQMDMVRLGIGLYGIDMAPKDLDLQEVSTLKTTITQIRELRHGETVGYDRKGVLQRNSKIATVKIGYADGYDRRLGNGVGQMLLHGHNVPTVGNVCMDMCMLDITGIDAREGDEVLVFPDVKKVARDIGTIPYELLTGISSRVKRVYYYE